MQPINYERHCKACHELTLSAGGFSLPIPHEKMDVVRSAVGAVPVMLLDRLAKDPDKAKKLVKEVKVGIRKKLEPIGEGEWIDTQVADLGENLSKELRRSPVPPGWENWLASVGAEKPLAGPAGWGVPLRKVELFLFYKASNACAKCHEQSVPPTSRPSAYAALETKPTSIPAMPRRWFTHSVFNHDAHRNESCISCHGAALSSERTTDVLMPDINSCVRCHHPNTTSRKGATSECVSCHIYHDRRVDRVPASAHEGEAMARSLLARKRPATEGSGP
jgi:hypothetical protein